MHHDGNACPNDVCVRRNHLESALLGQINERLLSPERVARMAKEMETYHQEHVRAMQTRATQTPRELQQLGARIERPRERLQRGDPDMAPDEIQAAIDRAEVKRRKLLDQQPEAKESPRVLSVLPRAAEMYRRPANRHRARRRRARGAKSERVPARMVLREDHSGSAAGRRTDGALERKRRCIAASGVCRNGW